MLMLPLADLVLCAWLVHHVHSELQLHQRCCKWHGPARGRLEVFCSVSGPPFPGVDQGVLLFLGCVNSAAMPGPAAAPAQPGSGPRMPALLDPVSLLLLFGGAATLSPQCPPELTSRTVPGFPVSTSWPAPAI